MLLLALTLVIVVVIAIPVGCLCAAMRGSVVDYGLRIGTYVAWAVPVFIVAILFQEGFGRIPGGWGTGWFPAVGWAGQCPGGQGIDPHNFQCPAAGHGLTHVAEVIYHLLLPALALALGFIGLHARYLRNSVIDALDAPYVTVARGKGLTERAVVMRHALRNAFVAFVPAIVSDLGVLFGGALVVDCDLPARGDGDSPDRHAPAAAPTGMSPSTPTPCSSPWCSPPCVMLAASLLGEVLLGVLDPRTRLD